MRTRRRRAARRSPPRGRDGGGLGDLAKDRVAGLVPEGVVHLLEMVNVEVDDGEVGAATALGPVEFLDQALFEEAVVEDAGQLVPEGHLLDLRAGVEADVVQAVDSGRRTGGGGEAKRQRLKNSL